MEIHRSYRYEQSMLILDFQKLDREIQEAVQEKTGLEDQLYRLENSYELI